MRGVKGIYLAALVVILGCSGPGGGAGEPPAVPLPTPPIVGAYPIDIDFNGLPNGPITGNEVIDQVGIDGNQAVVNNGVIELSPGQVFFQPPDAVEQVSVMMMDSSSQSSTIVVGRNASGGDACKEFPWMPGDYNFYTCAAGGNAISRLEVASQSSSVMRVIFSMLLNFIAFERSAELSLTGVISDVTVKDFDGDGFDDIALAAPYKWLVQVLYGDESGAMSRSEFVYTQGTTFDATAADLNGDGYPELVSSLPDKGEVKVFENLGGAFDLGTPYAAAGAPGAIAVGDINGDGSPDLAVAGTSGVSLLFNDGAGAFGPFQQAAGIAGEVSDIAMADMDLDGDADLAILVPGTNSIEIWLGDNAGGFSLLQSTFAGNSPLAMAVETLDWDRYPEVVAASLGNPNFKSWLNLKDGSLVALQSFQAVAGKPADMTLTDINADGFADMAVADADSGELAVFMSQLSMGQFQIAAVIDNGPAPVAIGAGDINGDNKNDLVTADYWGTVRVYLNVSH